MSSLSNSNSSFTRSALLLGDSILLGEKTPNTTNTIYNTTTTTNDNNNNTTNDDLRLLLGHLDIHDDDDNSININNLLSSSHSTTSIVENIEKIGSKDIIIDYYDNSIVDNKRKKNKNEEHELLGVRRSESTRDSNELLGVRRSESTRDSNELLGRSPESTRDSNELLGRIPESTRDSNELLGRSPESPRDSNELKELLRLLEHDDNDSVDNNVKEINEKVDNRVKEIRVELFKEKELEVAALRDDMMILQRRRNIIDKDEYANENLKKNKPPIILKDKYTLSSNDDNNNNNNNIIYQYNTGGVGGGGGGITPSLIVSALARPQTPLPITPFNNNKLESNETQILHERLLRTQKDLSIANADRDEAYRKLEILREESRNELTYFRVEQETHHRRVLGDFRDRCHEAYRSHLDEFAKAAKPLGEERARLEQELILLKEELNRSRETQILVKDRLKQSFSLALRKMKEDLQASKKRNSVILEHEWKARRLKYDNYWLDKLKRLKAKKTCESCSKILNLLVFDEQLSSKPINNNEKSK